MGRANGVKTRALFFLCIFFTLSSISLQVESLNNLTNEVRASGLVTYGVGEVICQRLEREVIINHFWQVFVTDVYKVSNVKIENVTNVFSKVYITLPRDAVRVSARDCVGTLRVSESLGVDPSSRVWEVLLRQSLRDNETTTFTVSYELEAKNYIEQISLDEFLFKLRVFERSNLTIRELHLKIKLPEGSHFMQDLSHDLNYKVEREFFSEVVYYTLPDLEPNSDFEVTIKYRTPVFSSSIKPLILTGVIVVMGALIITKLKRGKPPTTEVKVQPKGFLQFVEAYKKKLSILEEEISLENRFRMGLASRKSYRKEKKRIEKTFMSSTQELKETRRRLGTVEPRIEDELRRIDLVENEVEVTRKEMERDNQRYQRGEISKSSYERLVAVYLKEIEKAVRTIEEALEKLKGGIA
ncbi:MAG: hypothetical protein QXL67_00540 [Candidatus Bathyarchaeia archaeon]